MLPTSFTLPISGGSKVLIKVNSDNYSSTYLLRESTCEWKAVIRHSTTKATAEKPSYDRHNVEVSCRIFATASVPEYERKTYLVIQQLPSDTDTLLADALADWLIVAGTIASLLGWES